MKLVLAGRQQAERRSDELKALTFGLDDVFACRNDWCASMGGLLLAMECRHAVKGFHQTA
jgi:hypothetical protein